MKDKRKIINIVLPLLGLGVVVYYSFCGGSCSFLQGDFVGIDLKYLGLVYAASLPVLTLMRQDLLQLVALSFGLGTEINLVAFQVKESTYCPYCLIFAGIIVFLFVFNFRRSKRLVMGASVLLGFLLFLLFFKGVATPVYADEIVIPSYGNGKVNVRLYTDYFCGPCSRLEPKAERLLADLIKRNSITLTFIDTPIHAHTPLYARYFLYILNHNKSFAYTLTTRAILFDAAKSKITDKEKLEEYLKKHDVKFKPFDARPSFLALNALIQEDKINRTPSCVIIDQGKRAVFSGEADIMKALELLK